MTTLGWSCRDHWGHVWRRNRMFLVCLQQTKGNCLPPGTSFFQPNTSTPIGKWWVEVFSRVCWREMLNCSFQGQNIQRWTWTCLSGSWCRQHPPTPVHGRDLQGLQRGGDACRAWERKSTPSLQLPATVPWNNTAAQEGLVFCFFSREIRSYFYTLVTAFGLSVKRGRFHSKCFGWHFLRNSGK